MKKDTVKEKLYKKLNSYTNIDIEAINALGKNLNLITIDKNKYLNKLYENKIQIGFVIEGVVRACYLSENGTEYNKHFFTENNFFMTSFNENVNSYVFTQTLTKCNIIIIDYNKYMELSEQYIVLKKALNLMFLECMEKKQEREIDLLSLEGKERYLKFNKDNPKLIKKISQFHIASYLGITPTQLSRIKKSTYVNDK